MAKLSSMMPKERTSATAPTTPATIPIRYSPGRWATFGVSNTTRAADITKAVEPSRDLPRYRLVPKRLPTRAATVSEMMRIEKAVMVMSFGKTKTQNVAEMRTHVAPFRVFFSSVCSWVLSILPKMRRYSAKVGG